ncbi:MAG TPA: hypothetical protein VGV35_18890 [Bryobacteraceae bacterium]|nr:hypothetical protein [Bryobacteraceae bacterium]
MSLSWFVLSMPPDGSDSSTIFTNPTLGRTGNPNAHGNPHFSNTGGNIFGLMTASTFGGAFAGQAGPSQGKLFKYTMLGNDPAQGGTTNIPTNIDEISWTLLNADATVFKVVQFAPFETLTLNSPNFRDSTYTSSSSPTQFADAVQRAEFFPMLQPGQPWHTRLVPSVVNKVNITVPRFVNVRLANGNIIQARSYFTGTAPDGSTFVLMLNLLFNFFFDNEAVNDINAGSFTTDGVNVTAFPNTFLFSLNVNNPNTPGGCCVLGFHTYFFDPSSVPQPRWLTLFESWISPGIFGGGFQDVTGLSHEVSETFNDPFLDNATPNWQFPGEPPNAKVCQNNLETGDPIEVLANATFPVTLFGYTYHPQNEALLQWFGMGPTSNAINGAFSYPGTTVLPHSALPCPM